MVFVHLLTKDHFISKMNFAPLVMDEKTSSQFLFDEGLLRTRMSCTDWDTPLNPINYTNREYPLYAKEGRIKYQFQLQRANGLRGRN